MGTADLLILVPCRLAGTCEPRHRRRPQPHQRRWVPGWAGCWLAGWVLEPVLGGCGPGGINDTPDHHLHSFPHSPCCSAERKAQTNRGLNNFRMRMRARRKLKQGAAQRKQESGMMHEYRMRTLVGVPAFVRLPIQQRPAGWGAPAQLP